VLIVQYEEETQEVFDKLCYSHMHTSNGMELKGQIPQRVAGLAVAFSETKTLHITITSSFPSFLNNDNPNIYRGRGTSTNLHTQGNNQIFCLGKPITTYDNNLFSSIQETATASFLVADQWLTWLVYCVRKRLYDLSTQNYVGNQLSLVIPRI
jgi:hypothetical protein